MKKILIIVGVIVAIFYVRFMVNQAIQSKGYATDRPSLGEKMAELNGMKAIVDIRTKLWNTYRSMPAPEEFNRSADLELTKLHMPGHEKTNDIEIYPDTIIQSVKDEIVTVDASKLKDTGKWGYIKSDSLGFGGWLFIDCTHAKRTGTKWCNWEPGRGG